MNISVTEGNNTIEKRGDKQKNMLMLGQVYMAPFLLFVTPWSLLGGMGEALYSPDL